MGSVQISLQEYKDIQTELETLRKEVKQKEVIRYYNHPAIGYGLLAIAFVIFIWISIKMP